MYPSFNDQPHHEAPNHSQMERTLVRHLQSLCRINPRTSFEDSVAMAEKIRSTLKREVQKIGEIAKDFREKYYAMEPGNAASDGQLDAQLYEFENMNIKQKIGTFWEKNPNFMERVKQHRGQKKEEDPGRQNLAVQRRQLPSQMEQNTEGTRQQMDISGGAQNGQVQQQTGDFQQLQKRQDPQKPVENVVINQNEGGIQRHGDQQVHQQRADPSQNNQVPQRPGPAAHHRQSYQPLQSAAQPTEPVVITLDSDPESPPLPYQQVVMPVDIQSAGGMARKRYPAKRAAPQMAGNYGNNNKQPAMVGRNYSGIHQQPAPSAPIRYRVVTNFPPGMVAPRAQQHFLGQNLAPHQMERQGGGLQQAAGIIQAGGQISRGRVVRYPRGRQPVLREMMPVALVPPPVPIAAPVAPVPVSLPQEQPPALPNEENNEQGQENCQDFDIDPEELAKAFFQ